jgi:hypothetical protein
MSKTEKLNEEQVFMQELDDDELEVVAGGEGCKASLKAGSNCVQNTIRDIYGGDGFPNCAATVEDGSWCSKNDACYNVNAIVYIGRTDCSKAWR